MEFKVVTLIVLIEAFALALLVIAGMTVYIRKLKSLLRSAQKKASQKAKSAAESAQHNTELSALPELTPPTIIDSKTEGDAVRSASVVAQPNSSQSTYTHFIDEHIQGVRDYHAQLNGGQDIALDLDPDSPVDRRTAAFRHAVLIAEREATLGDDVSWVALEQRYKALLSYYEDYPSAQQADSKMQELDDALAASRQQAASLEKYKALYFDLEASWHASKTQADDYYEQIQGKVALFEGERQSELVDLVGQYHRSYDTVTTVFEGQNPLPETLEVATQELRELRKMTSEQYQLIDDLKQKIKNADNDGAKVDLIRELEDELIRHKRFLGESELCIQLMEDELTVTHKELQSLKSKLGTMPNLKAHIKELESDAGVTDVVLCRLKEEVADLKAALAVKKESRAPAAPINDVLASEEGVLEGAIGGVSKRAVSHEALLKTEGLNEGGVNAEHLNTNDEHPLMYKHEVLLQEHNQLKKQYADLEERYLDLKLEG